jgi:predicted nucleic acid-binding protein
MNEPVLVDTGPLLAFYSEEDAFHETCQAQMQRLPLGKAYTCWPVIVEAAYMLRKRPEQRDDLLLSIIKGYLEIKHLGARDLESVRDIFTKYHDQAIDLADACLLHLADRERIDTVFSRP